MTRRARRGQKTPRQQGIRGLTPDRAGLLRRAAAACRERRGDGDELEIAGMKQEPEQWRSAERDLIQRPPGELEHGPRGPVLSVR